MNYFNTRNTTVSCLLACLLIGCASGPSHTPNGKKEPLTHYPNQEAVKKNNEAIAIMRWHVTDTDSLKKAIRLFDEAIRIDPTYKLAYTNKAQYLLYLHEKAKALEVILQIEHLEKDNPEYYVYRGMLLEVNGREEEAQQSYAKAIPLQERRFWKQKDLRSFTNYAFTLYIKDGKERTLEEVAGDLAGEVLAEDKDHSVRDMFKALYRDGKDRQALLEQMLGLRNNW